MIYTEEKALSNLAALCSRGEHCAGELDEKMRRWGLDEGARRRVLDYLRSHQFVDDARYCRSFVNDKVKYDRWGRRKIEQALWAKHIDPQVSASALDAVDDEDYLTALRPLLKAKWPTIKAKSDYERSMKLINYAMGRGFELRLIRKCIDEMGEITDVDDDD
ncbi:MAG: RecX family transcriptional regulator [Prevotella sp.]|nr:RecX family transcriptional regulator [Prevotella sp.]